MEKEIQEKINSIYDHIHGEHFQKLRQLVETPMNLDKYQNFVHPQMASMHHHQSQYMNSRPTYQYNQYDDGYDDPYNRNHNNRQYRPKPNYPHAYPKAGNGDFRDKRNAVPDEEVHRRFKKEVFSAAA